MSQENLNPFRQPDTQNPPEQAVRGLSVVQIVVLTAFCVAAVCTRLIDSHMPNLSCLGAVALFCGSALRGPKWLLLPLAIRVVTDIVIHLKTGYGFFPSWPFDYSAYVLIWAVGLYVPKKRYTAVLAGAAGSVVIYFLLSNFGVWLIWPDTYPRTLAGLTECYVNAVPFARGTVMGNLIAAPVFFAAWNAVSAGVPSVSSLSEERC